TRHGIGTFVLGLGEGGAFRIAPEQMATLNDVVAVLELRIGIETEAAALAAQRRSEAQLQAMREALAAFSAAAEAGRDAVTADFQFHLEIARATGNPHYEQLMATLGAPSIPRARLPGLAAAEAQLRLDYLRQVNAEHRRILEAIAVQDGEAARAAMRAHLAMSLERRRRVALALQTSGVGAD
ncbi:MAG: FCD domain-containing protein, partial [Burkholderiaceae bacterium]